MSQGGFQQYLRKGPMSRHLIPGQSITALKLIRAFIVCSFILLSVPFGRCSLFPSLWWVPFSLACASPNAAILAIDTMSCMIALVVRLQYLTLVISWFKFSFSSSFSTFFSPLRSWGLSSSLRHPRSLTPTMGWCWRKAFHLISSWEDVALASMRSEDQCRSYFLFFRSFGSHISPWFRLFTTLLPCVLLHLLSSTKKAYSMHYPKSCSRLRKWETVGQPRLGRQCIFGPKADPTPVDPQDRILAACVVFMVALLSSLSLGKHIYLSSSCLLRFLVKYSITQYMFPAPSAVIRNGAPPTTYSGPTTNKTFNNHKASTITSRTMCCKIIIFFDHILNLPTPSFVVLFVVKKWKRKMK